MNQVSEITDVEFKEVPRVTTVQDPVTFLTEALRAAGYADPEGWKQGLNPAASTSPEIGERLFLVNRSLCLYLSEVRGKGDNIVPRMFISGGMNYDQWTQVIKDGVVAWLMEQFDLKTGKRIAPPTVFTPGEEDDSAIGLNLASTEDTPVEWPATINDPKPFPPAVYKDGELVDAAGITEVIPNALNKILAEAVDRDVVLTLEQEAKLKAFEAAREDGELELSPTIKVQGFFRGASTLLEFQDTSVNEYWFKRPFKELQIADFANNRKFDAKNQPIFTDTECVSIIEYHSSNKWVEGNLTVGEYLVGLREEDGVTGLMYRFNEFPEVWHKLSNEMLHANNPHLVTKSTLENVGIITLDPSKFADIPKTWEYDTREVTMEELNLTTEEQALVDTHMSGECMAPTNIGNGKVIECVHRNGVFYLKYRDSSNPGVISYVKLGVQLKAE